MMKASVIIPTYNRKEYLREALLALAQSTEPPDNFEVIIVDDGSTDNTKEIAQETFSFTLRYFWQTNQGDAIARNFGVKQSQADVLVFLDDDILVEPEYLTYLLKEHEDFANRIVVGTQHLWLKETNPLNESISARESNEASIVPYNFVDVCSNNMSLRREAYYKIGLMQKLDFPGSNIWCDVDFAYRAHLQGFKFFRSTRALCYHRDYVARNLDSSKQRMRKVAYRAVSLFQKYPNLLPYLPMFQDKTPVVWDEDTIFLIVRKLARHLASSWPVLVCLEQLAVLLERKYPTSAILRPLRRWVVGGYIFQGYREGLHEYGLTQKKPDILRE